MAFPWAAAAAFAAPIIGGLFGSSGAEDQNEASAVAAQRQMDFQERMSNTQYQRSMADMRKAGLNPILAYRQGGAGNLGGSTYSPVNVGAAGVAGAQAGYSSALANRRFKLEQRKNIAEIDKLYTSASKDSADADLATHQRMKTQGELKLIKQQEQMNMPDVASAKHAKELYEGPAGSFFKWWKMLKGK